jgi:transposase
MDFGSDDEARRLMSTHKPPRMLGGQILTAPERRRRWSHEEKLRLLFEAEQSGSSASLVCQRYRLPSSLFYTWRKQYRSGELAGFAPVAIVADVPAKNPASRPPRSSPVTTPAKVERSSADSVIEVILPGGVRLRIPADVDGARLAMVIAALRQS